MMALVTPLATPEKSKLEIHNRNAINKFIDTDISRGKKQNEMITQSNHTTSNSLKEILKGRQMKIPQLSTRNVLE